ncbi:ABC transporter permease [Pendulispora albinea]|uniref:ABC transporter permease n=1 Tax=Pendulispora albinea TaxID=2741071 RepID=A0ABZ2LWL4_9BACT
MNSARFSALRELVLMRWRVFYREPGTMFWTFGLPVVLSIALGLAFQNKEPEAVPAAVQDGPRAEHVQQVLVKNHELIVKKLPAAEAHEALRTGKVHVIVIPGETADAKVTYRFDPTRPDSRLARLLVDDTLQRGEGRPDTVPTAKQHVTEPGSRYIDFLIPGLVGMGLMSSGLWGIGFALAEMRTRKLLKRLVATPMRKSDFMLSFLIVRAGLLVIELPPLLVFSYLVFKVGVAGSVLTLLLVALLGALVFAGMGLLFASRSENPQIVSGLINVATFPMYLCSGVFFSTARFPDWTQPFVKFLPLTALIDGLRAVMIDGAGFAQITSPLIVLVIWGFLCFAGTLKLFRWR